MLSWWTFTATFAFLRLLTWAIRIHVAGVGNISAGGTHLHHYLWGILLVVTIAFIGLVEPSPSWRTWMGALLGVGLALIVDEIALLVELKDVYWSGAGEVSIAVALIAIGIAGGVLALTRAPHRDD